MSRLIATALAVAALLAVAGVALATAGGGAREQQRRSAAPDARANQVVDLSSAAGSETARRDERTRPREDVGDQDLAAIERDIKRRAERVLGASPDDGIAPGAPSDAEVRSDLRAMRSERDGGGPIKRGSGDFIYPIDGAFSSPFGMRWGRLHAGVDLAAPAGRPIRAAAAGRVILAAPTGGYGNYTCIAHNSSISTCYAHQSRFGVRVGESVRQGEVIGYVGNTGHSFGAHLHFEVRIGGRPVDPMKYL
ncbi:MAG TPA: M23 family metallopeptidase [Thermoleophilaceae bacterium]|jgi:murein DD-endopeptidase MepM/ murein hydrolase activator NlpD